VRLRLTARRLACRGSLGVLLLVGFGGCVGLVRDRLDWVHVGSEVRTKAEAQARFGEPQRKMLESGRDVWYYRLSGLGPSGRRPATEGATIAYVGIGPFWWTRRPDENVRIDFEGDAVSGAAELRTTQSGFFCGVNLAYGGLFMCSPVP